MIIFNTILVIATWNLLMSILNKRKTNLLYCGIIGFSGSTKFDKQKIDTLLLWNSFVRGEDSTGIYSPKNGVIKNTDKGSKFILSTPYEEDTLLIAHVRAKTIGAATEANAHPFLEENVCLVHNGTLKNHYGLSRKYDLAYNKYDVDSHIMCAIMAKEKNFKVLSEIDGAAAVLINDTDNPNIMYAYRNSERPLFKGSIDGNMYISSIKDSLEFIGCKNIKEFKENYLYTIINGLIQGAPRKIVSKPYAHVFNNVSNNNTNFLRNGNYTGHNKPKPIDLINMMLTYDHKASTMDNDSNFTLGKEYKITGVDDIWKVKVIDDFNKEVSMYPYKFATTLEYFSKDDYVKPRQTIVYTKNQQVAVAMGTVCLVQSDINGKIKVLNLTTNEYVVADKFYFKTLTKLELDIFNTIETSSDTLNFAPESFDISSPVDYFNKAEEVNYDEVVEDDEDEVDISYYDLSVNEESLINSLENIKIASNDLNDFIAKFIPEENMLEYKTKKMELNECLSDTLEEYNVTVKT